MGIIKKVCGREWENQGKDSRGTCCDLAEKWGSLSWACCIIYPLKEAHHSLRQYRTEKKEEGFDQGGGGGSLNDEFSQVGVKVFNWGD